MLYKEEVIGSNVRKKKLLINATSYGDHSTIIKKHIRRLIRD
jgi:hypothetical protein